MRSSLSTTLKLLTIGILLFSTSLFAQKETADPVLLSIDKQDITLSEFLSVYKKNNLEGEVLDRKSLEEYLELYINFKLKVREAEELGMDTVQSFINELEGYRDQLAKPYFVDEKLNEQLLKEVVQRQFDTFSETFITPANQVIEISDDGKTAWFSQMMNYNFILNGEPYSFRNLRYTGVLVKKEGKWKLVQTHMSVAYNPLEK
jgi:hypothetical protein